MSWRARRDLFVTGAGHAAPMNTVLPARSTALVPAGVMLTAAVLALTGTLLIGGDDDGAEAREPVAVGAASPVPYVGLAAGDCFDHPGLSNSAGETRTRPCGEPHDAEVIARQKLTGKFRSEARLRERARELCAAHSERRLARVPQDGRSYRTYAVHPSLDTYRQHARAAVGCAVTLDEDRRGPADPKLTAPLPSAEPGPTLSESPSSAAG